MPSKHPATRARLEAKGYSIALIFGGVLLIIGLTLQYSAIQKQRESAPPDGSRSNAPYLQLAGTAIVSVAMAIATLGTGVLFRNLWMNLADRRKDRNFRRFFGESAISDSLRLVHAERKLEDSSVFKYSSPTADSHITRTKSTVSPVPEGTGRWLSSEDNYAGTAITALFSQKSTLFPRNVYDTFIEDDRMGFCAVGLGLGFNEFTHFLCVATRYKMFRIIFKFSVKSPDAKFITDEFALPIFGEAGSSMKWQFPTPSKNTDVALILRVPAKLTEDADHTTRFLVAGRSATGTAVAGAFLATQWERLEKLYGENKKAIDRDALLLILEHKMALPISNIDPHGAIHTLGATPYKGPWKDLEDSAPDFEKSLDDGDKEIIEFSKSIQANGYGFYDPNPEKWEKKAK